MKDLHDGPEAARLPVKMLEPAGAVPAAPSSLDPTFAARRERDRLASLRLSQPSCSCPGCVGRGRTERYQRSAHLCSGERAARN